MWGKLALIIASVSLLAAGCRAGDSAGIGSLAIGREIAGNNQVIENITTIPATAKAIYLSGLVTNPSSSTRIKVSWYQLPNSIIATEEFAGNKKSNTRFDFNNKAQSSYFASHIERQGLAWAQGEYRADVFLGGNRSGSVFFKIVSDSDADAENNASLLRSVKFGSALGADGQLVISETSFERSTDQIYIQVELAPSQSSPSVEVSVRQVGQQKPINTFTTTAGQQRTLIFDLPLERFGRNWTDRLWPAGGYQVEVKLNGTSVETLSYIVK